MKKQIVLMFHDVYDTSPGESGFTSPAADFYKIDSTTFERYVEATQESKQNFVFTFDDGGVSFYTIAAPILEKYGKKGIFFIATKYIGQKGFLTPSQIEDLDKRGHIIGSHSHNHVNLSELSEAEIYAEWKESSDILSSIVKHPIEYASLPNGDSSDAVAKMAEKVGITRLYTSVSTTDVTQIGGGKITLNGRFVLTKVTTIEHIKKLQSANYRLALRLRSSVLNFLKKILGSNYKKIKTLIFK